MSPYTVLYFKRVEREGNVARFYALWLQPTLFGEISLVREWGRLGTRGRFKAEIFPTVPAASRQMERLARAKQRRGYLRLTSAG